jgi:hypothetical protein
MKSSVTNGIDSANIKNSTFGTQFSKSIFNDGLSNLSNFEEHELIEQSKLADQKIQLLQKQVEMLEQRKKLDQLIQETDNRQ